MSPPRISLDLFSRLYCWTNWKSWEKFKSRKLQGRLSLALRRGWLRFLTRLENRIQKRPSIGGISCLFACLLALFLVLLFIVFTARKKIRNWKIDQCEFHKRVNCLSRDSCETKWRAGDDGCELLMVFNDRIDKLHSLTNWWFKCWLKKRQNASAKILLFSPRVPPSEEDVEQCLEVSKNTKLSQLHTFLTHLASFAGGEHYWIWV